MARIGYSRVSSLDQDLDGQVARLQAEGCTIVRSEKVSGASREGRPELAIVLQFLRIGDELVVTRCQSALNFCRPKHSPSQKRRRDHLLKRL